MMTKDQEKAAKAVWGSLSQKARDNWSVWDAANDPKVLATTEVLDGQPETESVRTTRQALRFYVWKEYENVPLNRYDDVFRAAHTIIEERLLSGEM